MPLVLIGLNHRSAPVEIREKLAFSLDQAGRMAAGLTSTASFEEALVLSTCNRTEVVVSTRDGIGAGAARDQIAEILSRDRSLEPEGLSGHLYAHEGVEAARHLFRVASSLDSMVLGEPQILGQVKDAYGAAARSGALGPRLERLLQRAFRVAKKIRTRTGIARNPVSVSYAAVDLAQKIFGSLAGRRAMILGAGKMADLAARHLVKAGIGSITVASRTLAHARETAAQYGGAAITLDRFREVLPRIDIVISSTAAPHTILGLEDARRLMKGRHGHPIFIIDIAVPRDIDPRVNEVDNVYLYDIDDLQKAVEAGREGRLVEAELAEAILEEEVGRFEAAAGSRSAAPTVVAMREKLHGLAIEELSGHLGRIGPVSRTQEEALRRMLRSLMNKVLHGPTREVKRAAECPAGAEAEELARRMFDLNDGGMLKESSP